MCFVSISNTSKTHQASDMPYDFYESFSSWSVGNETSATYCISCLIYSVRHGLLLTLLVLGSWNIQQAELAELARSCFHAGHIRELASGRAISLVSLRLGRRSIVLTVMVRKFKAPQFTVLLIWSAHWHEIVRWVQRPRARHIVYVPLSTCRYYFTSFRPSSKMIRKSSWWDLTKFLSDRTDFLDGLMNSLGDLEDVLGALMDSWMTLKIPKALWRIS